VLNVSDMHEDSLMSVAGMQQDTSSQSLTPSKRLRKYS